MTRPITVTRTIAAPRDRVFRALTDAEELARWFPSSAESDARTGGAFRYRFEFDDASRDHTYTGEYIDVRAGERVSYPWRGALGETRVDVELRGDERETIVTLTHSGWGDGHDWSAARQMHEDGWNFFVSNLQSFLEDGSDARATTLGQKTGAAIAT